MGACVKMINSNAVASQIVAVGNNVLFTADKITSSNVNNYGCCAKYVQHDAGSGLFTISQPGIYRILFRANVTSTSTGTASVSIESNGEAMAESTTTDTIATASAPVSTMTFADVVIPCGGGSRTISIGNAGTIPLTVTNANIEIRKLC